MPTCAQLTGAACTKHYFFEACREGVGVTLGRKHTCNNVRGKSVKLLYCSLSGGVCSGCVTNPLETAFIGCC